MGNNRISTREWIERTVLALVFIFIGGIGIVVFNPWGRQWIANRVDNYLWRVGLSFLLLVISWLVCRSERYRKLGQITFALFVLFAAISLDWVLGRFLFDSLHVSDATPAGWALPKLNENYYTLAHSSGTEMIPETMYRFQQSLKQESDIDGDLVKMNEKYDTEYAGWEIIPPLTTGVMNRRVAGPYSTFSLRGLEFVKQQTRENLNFVSLDAFFIEDQLKVKYGADVRKMNETIGTDYRTWGEVCLSRLKLSRILLGLV